jgi:hypothetical protein
MRTTPIVAILAGALLLGGCAASPATGDGAVTLLDTKLTAQLLRNNVSGQISSSSIEEMSQVSDASEACDDDPAGMVRRWRSTALTELTAERASKVSAIAQTISGSLAVKGWTPKGEQLTDTSFVLTLTNADSLAQIQITTTEDEDGDGQGATIFVDVTGPCVATAGPGSDELAVLGE